MATGGNIYLCCNCGYALASHTLLCNHSMCNDCTMKQTDQNTNIHCPICPMIMPRLEHHAGQGPLVQGDHAGQGRLVQGDHASQAPVVQDYNALSFVFLLPPIQSTSHGSVVNPWQPANYAPPPIPNPAQSITYPDLSMPAAQFSMAGLSMMSSTLPTTSSTLPTTSSTLSTTSSPQSIMHQMLTPSSQPTLPSQQSNRTMAATPSISTISSTIEKLNLALCSDEDDPEVAGYTEGMPPPTVDATRTYPPVRNASIPIHDSKPSQPSQRMQGFNCSNVSWEVKYSIKVAAKSMDAQMADEAPSGLVKIPEGDEEVSPEEEGDELEQAEVQEVVEMPQTDARLGQQAQEQKLEQAEAQGLPQVVQADTQISLQVQGLAPLPPAYEQADESSRNASEASSLTSNQAIESCTLTSGWQRSKSASPKDDSSRPRM